MDNFGRTLSPWWRRAVAIIIDSLVIGIPTTLFFDYALGLHLDFVTSANKSSITYSNTGAYFTGELLQFAVFLAYFAVLDGSARGQTLGKMLLRICTRDAQTGGRIGHARAFARRLVYSLLFFLCFLPGLINALSPIFDRNRAAWHDKLLGTVVVDVPPER